MDLLEKEKHKLVALLYNMWKMQNINDIKLLIEEKLQELEFNPISGQFEKE